RSFPADPDGERPVLEAGDDRSPRIRPAAAGLDDLTARQAPEENQLPPPGTVPHSLHSDVASNTHWLQSSTPKEVTRCRTRTVTGIISPPSPAQSSIACPCTTCACHPGYGTSLWRRNTPSG